MISQRNTNCEWQISCIQNTSYGKQLAVSNRLFHPWGRNGKVVKENNLITQKEKR